MIHGSYGRNNRPGANGLVANENFLFTKMPIGRLNADRLLLTYQLELFGSSLPNFL